MAKSFSTDTVSLRLTPTEQLISLSLQRLFGIDGMRVHNDSEVESVLEKAFNLKKPVIVDCVLSPDENVLPMIPPGKTVDDMITEME